MSHSNICPTCQQRVMSPKQQRMGLIVGLTLGFLGAAIGTYASVFS